MKAFAKILCPYDFSVYADEALRYAAKLATSDTAITLLNVIQVPYSLEPSGIAYYDMKFEDLRVKTETSLQKKLSELTDQYPGVHFDTQISLSIDPSDLILSTQKDGGFDLVVMGSHGRKGLRRLLLGSVAESVMRDATCPVLIIKTR
jgi:universal stress protein A